ncbi:egg-derived tyrosine phosphatase isoform X2 [Rhynchophorus ferrugineus]
MGEPESAITAFNEATICDVLSTFVATTYHADKENKKNPYIDAVIFLMEKDYKVIKLPNESGNLSFQYPNIIPIMESSRHVTTIYENEENETPLLDSSELLKLCEKAKFARCRQRFPVPVILFNGQHICRSATLASVPEICYRGNYSFNGTEFLKALLEFLWPSEESGPELPSADAGQYESKLPKYCDTVRNDDMKLLKALNVFNIVDIMVERRKVKHGLYVSASEKVDRERYKDFRLMSLPYPGCEFFVNFHNNLLKPESLFYDWSDPSNDAELTIPNDDFQNCMNISWERYKYWDLVYMTQNYLKYIIKRLQDDNCGLLLHCISGWDRTPLFISLLRLSLWADGLVHDTLSEYEILYLTLTYDWYLFGHHLSNRMAKNEEIMAFCFEMLKYIIGDEYSGKPSKKRVSEESANSATNPCPLEEVDCRDKLSTGTSDSNVNGSPIYTNYDESMVQDNDSPPQLSSEKVTTGSVKSSPIASPSNKLRNGSGMSKTIEALTFENQTTTASDCSPASNGGESKEQEKTTCVTRLEINEQEVAASESKITGLLADAMGTTMKCSTNLTGSKTSPVTIGSPCSRQRSSSTGSTSSNVSGNWVLINECGSVEQDQGVKPCRQFRLERVRTIFMSSYQKTVKMDSYGPQKGIVEDLVLYISSLLTSSSNVTDQQNSTPQQ